MIPNREVDQGEEEMEMEMDSRLLSSADNDDIPGLVESQRILRARLCVVNRGSIGVSQCDEHNESGR